MDKEYRKEMLPLWMAQDAPTPVAWLPRSGQYSQHTMAKLAEAGMSFVEVPGNKGKHFIPSEVARFARESATLVAGVSDKK